MILSFCGTKNAIISLFLAHLYLEPRNSLTNAHLLDSIQAENFNNDIKNITEDNLMFL